jgi:hypothetical protein
VQCIGNAQTLDQQLGAGTDGWRALFAPEMRGRTMLVCGLQAGVQLSGPTDTFYGTYPFVLACARPHHVSTPG